MSTATSTLSKDSSEYQLQARTRRLADPMLLWPLLVAFIGLGIWYSLAIPPFETPDEVYHYAFARHVAQGNGLPVQESQATGPWEQEGSQAPLFYLAVGRLSSAIDQSDLAQLSLFNPRSNMGDPLYPGNKNRMLYSAVRRPLRGTNLALHVGRWFSLLLGALTLWLIYLAARLALPPRSSLALMAPLLVACTPQFLFVSASFSNDSMIIVTSAAVLFWLARLLGKELDEPVHMWEWLILGILLGLAALSKLQGLGLLVLAATVGLTMAWLRRDWRLPFRAVLPVTVPVLAVAGWWYWRNATLYGDWTGLSHLVAINGLRTERLGWDEWWLEFRGLRYSFWGLFGWFNILLPQWFYTVMDLTSLAALLGFFLAMVGSWRSARSRWLQDPSVRVRLLMAGWVALSFLLLLYWMNRATGSQGRLLFPAISAIAVILVIGLDFWLRPLPRQARGIAWSALPLLLLGCSLYTVAFLIPSAYAATEPIQTLPPSAHKVNISHGDAEKIKLLAIDAPSNRFYPGEDVPITLYMSAPAQLQQDYELFIQLLDETGTEIGNVTTHSGWGRNPTSLWQPGAIYPDSYLLRVRRDVGSQSPLEARIYTGFINPETADIGNFPLTARNESGEEITPIPATVDISPNHPPQADDYDLQTVGSLFGSAIILRGAQYPLEVGAGEPFTVTLMWEASSTPNADYTAFVHLLDAAGTQVAGFDQAPAKNRFPTSHWQSGDRIVSQLQLLAPADKVIGQYDLWVGLYDSLSQGQERLSVTDAAGQDSAHNMVRLGSVMIQP